MKFDVLHNFISPVTGRILCDPTFVLVGDSNGIATPSSIIVDILDASFVIGSPNASLPNAQVLDALDDGYVFNTAGTISTTPTVIPFLTDGYLWIGDATNSPAENKIINIDNLPGLGVTIFPDPISLEFVGEIWEGTAAGRPVVSQRLGAMFADLLAINARFALAHFVLNEGNPALRLAMPFSQFLVDLAPGGIAKVEATGQISIAAAGTDYLDVGAPPPGDGVIPILEPGPYPPNPKLIYPSTIHIIGTDDVIGINSLKGNILSAANAVTSDDIMVSKNNVQTKSLLLSDQTPAFTKFAILKGPALLLNDVEWVLPDQQGVAGQVLTNTDGTVLAFKNVLPDGLNDNVLAQGRDGFNNPIIVNAALADGNLWIGDAANSPVASPNISLNNLPDLQQNYLWIGDGANRPEAKLQIDLINLPDLQQNYLWIGDAGGVAQETSNIFLDNLPSLSSGKVWRGDAFNRPEESDVETGNVSGPEPGISIDGNVAIWDGIDGRKIKDSEFSIAELEALAEEAEASAEEAAAAAEEATAAAGEAAAAAAEATAAAEEATGAASEATGAAIAATFSAIEASISSGNASGHSDDASDYADDAASSAGSAAGSAGSAAGSAAASLAHLNTLLTTDLVLTGDVTASNLIQDPIVTTFAPNPIFSGVQSLTFPAGTTAERPVVPISGMARYNTDLLNFEVYNGSSWITMGVGGGSVTSITAGVGLTGGTITTSGTISLSSPVSLVNGGTNASLIASNGGVFYSTATAGAILSGTATANQILLSGANDSPSWSTVTYPSTTTINQLLYSSADDIISELATTNDGVLITSATGVPSISSTVPSLVQENITSLGTITSGIWQGSTVTVPYGGTGVASTIPYAVLCGGTTSTGELQSVASLGTTGQTLTSLGAAALPVWETKAFCSIFMASNATPTTIVTANVYVKVAGITTLNTSNLFTMPSSNRITYTGSRSINVLVNVTLSYSDTGATPIYDIFTLFKNSIILSNVAPIETNPGNQRAALSISAIVPMGANDYLEVFATATSNGEDITVQNLNFLVTQL